jgi:hypothetical protein
MSNFNRIPFENYYKSEKFHIKISILDFVEYSKIVMASERYRKYFEKGSIYKI